MYEPNIPELLKQFETHPEWQVLDVGGGEQPLMRANWVIDKMDPHLSGDQGVIGDSYECQFNYENWIQHDICEAPWPFEDKQFDFIFCSNVLEDVRDPLVVLREMSRAGKAGYIECPTPTQEMKHGVDERCPDGRGYFHHRWIVFYRSEILTFMPKLPVVDGDHDINIREENCGFDPFYWQDQVQGAEVHVTSVTAYIQAVKAIVEKTNV